MNRFLTTPAAPVLVALLHLLPATLLAQDPVPSLFGKQPVTLSEQANDRTGATGIWAAGPAYKASFHDGFKMTLPVGRHTPTAPVFEWRTSSVRIDGVEQRLQAGVPRIATPQRCEYDLGAVLEAYEVGAQGVEQTFVVRAPITGELVVRGNLAGDFVATETTPRHGEVQLVDREGRRQMTYGAATAVDAAGHTLPLQTAATGDTIELRVPAAWLAAATYPVVVDPWLTSQQIEYVYGQNVAQIAIEHDDFNPTFNVGIAFDYAYSATDHDVFFYLAHDGFTGATSIFARNSYDDETSPDIAYVPGNNHWVIAFAKRTATQEGCYWHPLNRAYLTSQSGVASQLVASQSGGRQRRPVVSTRGGALPNHTDVLLLREWEAPGTAGNTGATEIWASYLHATTWQEVGAFRLAGGGSPFASDAEAAAVTRNGTDGTWVVAWQHWGALASKWQVQVRQLLANGSLANGILTTDRGGFAEHLTAPRLAGAAGRYLLGFGTVDSGTSPGHIGGGEAQALRSMRFDWDAGAMQGVASPSRSLAWNPQRTLNLGAIAHDTNTRSHWAVTWSTGLLPITHLQVVGYHGLPLHTETVQPSTAVPTAVTFDAAHDRFEVAYVTDWGYVAGREWEYPAQTLPVVYGAACAPGTMAAIGTFRLGSEFSQVELQNAPASTIVLLMLSTQPANLDLAALGFPGCTLLVDAGAGAYVGGIAMLTDAAGLAAFQLPLPEALSPLDLFCQWAVLHASLAGGIGASAGLHVEIR